MPSYSLAERPRLFGNQEANKFPWIPVKDDYVPTEPREETDKIQNQIFLIAKVTNIKYAVFEMIPEGIFE